jgi:glutamate racemase
MLGLFDSGSGGLTVLSALRERAPKIDIVYFGDIANAPYGLKSHSVLNDLTHAGVALLRKHGVTALVSACNSVSSSILEGAAEPIPFVEMSLPTAEYLRQYIGQRFLLLATPATVDSGLYAHATENFLDLDSLPIPDLASAIEFEHPMLEIKAIIEDALSSRTGESYDGLILGCTHYPLVRSLIAEAARRHFGDVVIVDPAYPVAKTASSRFGIAGSGKTHVMLSKYSDPFIHRIEKNLPANNYSLEIVG